MDLQLLDDRVKPHFTESWNIWEASGPPGPQFPAALCNTYLRWSFLVAMQHLTPTSVMSGKLLSTFEVTLTSEALKLELSSPRFYHS